MKPILVLPAVGPDGSLRWHVRSETEVATVVADTGEVFRSSPTDTDTEAFQAVVGALAEWYKADLAKFYSLNIDKVKTELVGT
jgi:hypothetical protein